MPENDLIKISHNKAMDLCSKREYCRHDISGKLQNWGLGSAESEKIISMLLKENFINEQRYSFAFVRDKFKYNKWGRVKIAAQLKTKHIPSEIIKSALDSIDNEAYIEILRTLILNHKKSVKAKNQYDLKGKLLRYGLSKGFESYLLYEMLNDLEQDLKGE